MLKGYAQDIELEMTELIDPGQVPMAVHGTSLNAWKSIGERVFCRLLLSDLNQFRSTETQGLSRMARNHIHLAQGLAGGTGPTSVISGKYHLHFSHWEPSDLWARHEDYFPDSYIHRFAKSSGCRSQVLRLT